MKQLFSLIVMICMIILPCTSCKSTKAPVPECDVEVIYQKDGYIPKYSFYVEGVVWKSLGFDIGDIPARLPTTFTVTVDPDNTLKVNRATSPYSLPVEDVADFSKFVPKDILSEIDHVGVLRGYLEFDKYTYILTEDKLTEGSSNAPASYRMILFRYSDDGSWKYVKFEMNYIEDDVSALMCYNNNLCVGLTKWFSTELEKLDEAPEIFYKPLSESQFESYIKNSEITEVKEALAEKSIICKLSDNIEDCFYVVFECLRTDGFYVAELDSDGNVNRLLHVTGGFGLYNYECLKNAADNGKYYHIDRFIK